jgi:hypothetical protein
MLPADGAPAAAPPGAPAVGPQVSVSLSPPTKAAQPTYSEFGTVSFDGNVELDSMPGERATVALTSATDTGWGCACAPSVLLLTAGTARAGFTVTVSVPPGTLASIVGVLTVTAEATGTVFSSTSSAHATITVLPYYMLRVQCNAPIINMSAGSEARFNVDILNLGNDNDSYDFRIDNERELRAAGWSVDLMIPTIPAVPPGGRMPVHVVIKSPPGLSAGKGAQAIELNVSSAGSRARGEVQSAVVVLQASLKGGLDGPFNLTMILVVVIAAAVAAALAWRWRRRRARRVSEARGNAEPIDVEPDD